MGTVTRARKRAALVVAATLAVAACGLVPPLDDSYAEPTQPHAKTHDFPPRTKVNLAKIGCFVLQVDGQPPSNTCDPPAQYPVLAYADETNRVVVFRNDEPATLRFQRGGVRELQNSGNDIVVQLDYATEPDDLYFSVHTATHVRACGVLLFTVVCSADQ